MFPGAILINIKIKGKNLYFQYLISNCYICFFKKKKNCNFIFITFLLSFVWLLTLIPR